MAKRVAVLLELPLKCRAGSARAEGCDLALPVQRQQAVHPFQGKGQHRLRAGGNVDMASHGGSAAIKDDGETLAVRPIAAPRALPRWWPAAPRRPESGRNRRNAWPANRESSARGRGGCAFPRRAIRADGKAARFGHLGHDRSQAGIGQNRARPVQELVQKRQRLGFQRKAGFLSAPAIPPAPAATQVPIQCSPSPKMAAPAKFIAHRRIFVPRGKDRLLMTWPYPHELLIESKMQHLEKKFWRVVSGRRAAMRGKSNVSPCFRGARAQPFRDYSIHFSFR